MKKVLSLFVATTLLLCCKKSDNNNTTVTVADGWNINGIHYNYSSCVKYGANSFKVYGDSSSLFITFGIMPTASGTYGIVGYKTATPVGNQLAFAHIGGVNGCSSKTTTSVAATITVTNGIINLIIPDVDVDVTNGTSKFSANISEK